MEFQNRPHKEKGLSLYISSSPDITSQFGKAPHSLPLKESGLLSSRGARVSIVLTVIRVTPWPPQRRILLGTKVLSSPSILCCANGPSPGVVAFFVLLFAILISQAYWECDITHSAWKHISGDICRFPRIVPIFELTGKLPHSLVPLSLCLPA